MCYSRVEQTGEYVFLAVRHRYQVDGRLGAQQIEIGFSTCQTERRRCERVAGIMLLTVIEQCPESLGITVGMLFGRNGDYGHTEIFQREKPVESVECKYIVLIEIAEENHSLQLAGFVEMSRFRNGKHRKTGGVENLGGYAPYEFAFFFACTACAHHYQHRLDFLCESIDFLFRNPFADFGGEFYCGNLSVFNFLFQSARKTEHQLFLEPEGETTQELYLNGFSSSLPMDIQIAALKKIPAFKDLVIYRPGYAIEYDYFDPTQLKHTLESKVIKNLFFAGQVNGTTGYEEAGGQGAIAGINAHINCHGGEEFTLARDEAYIGVLIDDLVTKGVDEPYRMFTSRAEYRILLRMDDADMRLTERAYKLGLAKEDRYRLMKSKKEAVEQIISFARNYSMKPALINDALEKIGTAPLRQGCKLIEILNRPQVTIENIAEHIPAFQRELEKATSANQDRKEEILEAAEILIKYQGYIDRERMIAEKLARLESIKIKGKFDYSSIQSLSTEARQKLTKIDPETIAQASRIPGVSPSDINVLLVLSGR